MLAGQPKTHQTTSRGCSTRETHNAGHFDHTHQDLLSFRSRLSLSVFPSLARLSFTFLSLLHFRFLFSASGHQFKLISFENIMTTMTRGHRKGWDGFPNLFALSSSELHCGLALWCGNTFLACMSLRLSPRSMSPESISPLNSNDQELFNFLSA